MTTIYDDRKTVEITMREWDNNAHAATMDWSNDFFGGAEWDADRGAYHVADVDYCIECAMDWRDCTGDFHDDELADGIERQVFVEEVEQ